MNTGVHSGMEIDANTLLHYATLYMADNVWQDDRELARAQALLMVEAAGCLLAERRPEALVAIYQLHPEVLDVLEALENVGCYGWGQA